MNPGILEPLLRDSPILEEVEADFGNWLKGKKEFEHITCFYEEFEVPSVGFVSFSNRCSAAPRLIHIRLSPKSLRL